MKPIKLKQEKSDQLVIEVLEEEKGFLYPCSINTNKDTRTGKLYYQVEENTAHPRITRLTFYEYRDILKYSLEKRGYTVSMICAKFRGHDHLEPYYEVRVNEIATNYQKRKIK